MASIMKQFDTIIVGAGLMGSAAARYLSGHGRRVAVVGAAEPAGKETDAQVYASHYDEGRLARRLSKNGIWVRLTKRAIEQFPELEEKSGVPFYRPVGCLHVGASPEEKSKIAAVRKIAATEEIPYTFYPAGDRAWRGEFLTLDFPAECQVLHEPAPAGMINPRAMLRAQLAVAQQQSATIFRETVVRVTEQADGVDVQTAEGNRLQAQNVLVAAGAFTNFNNLLPRSLPLKLKTETVILGEVTPAAATALVDMPIVTYQIDDPEINDIYMTPPVRYPDGRYYVKMGCNTAADSWPETLAEVQTWFRTGDSDVCKPAMTRALRAMLPETEFLSMTTGRCIICYTPSGFPAIDAVSERSFVATGGNGSSAKCSDTLGYLAAGLIHDGRWPGEIERSPFRLHG